MDLRRRISSKELEDLYSKSKSIVAVLEFKTFEKYNEYKKKHKIRPTTQVYVDGNLIQPGENHLKGLERKDDGSFYFRDRKKVIPNYVEITPEQHPEKSHDEDSGVTPEVKEEQKQKCKEDVEKLYPGLWEESQKVYESLDPREQRVISSYTYRDLYDLNKTIFDIKRGRASNLSKKQFHELNRMRRVLKKLPCFKGTLYRGMRFDTMNNLDNFIESFKIGSFPLTGFISSSFNPEKARGYLKDAKYKLMITIEDSTKGHYIGHLSSTPNDEEVLFDMNQRFRMTGDEWEDDEGIVHITLKEI